MNLGSLARLELSDLEKVENLLSDWAKWMAHDPRIGFNSRVPILSTGMGSSTFEELLEQVDGLAMRAVDASVDSLPPSNKAAIYRAYGICAVYRFPRDNYAECLEKAHDLLCVTLKRKGILGSGSV